MPNKDKGRVRLFDRRIVALLTDEQLVELRLQLIDLKAAIDERITRDK